LGVVTPRNTQFSTKYNNIASAYEKIPPTSGAIKISRYLKSNKINAIHNDSVSKTPRIVKGKG